MPLLALSSRPWFSEYFLGGLGVLRGKALSVPLRICGLGGKALPVPSRLGVLGGKALSVPLRISGLGGKAVHFPSRPSQQAKGPGSIF